MFLCIYSQIKHQFRICCSLSSDSRVLLLNVESVLFRCLKKCGSNPVFPAETRTCSVGRLQMKLLKQLSKPVFMKRLDSSSCSAVCAMPSVTCAIICLLVIKVHGPREMFHFSNQKNGPHFYPFF